MMAVKSRPTDATSKGARMIENVTNHIAKPNE